MDIKEKILNMRLNEFGLAKEVYFGEPEKDSFPERINVVVYEKLEKPMKCFVMELNDYALVRETNFVIGTLVWNDHEPCWEFESCGTRYLEYGTEELNKWLCKFCNEYEIEDGEIRRINKND